MVDTCFGDRISVLEVPVVREFVDVFPEELPDVPPERVGKVAYRLDLPEELSQIHNNFHVSELRKCVLDNGVVVQFDDIQVDEHLNYVERPIAILERKMKVLCNKEIPSVKVQWQHRRDSEWTWESKAEMREHYAELFTTVNFEDEV
ncbi:hypothetical protein Lser_V15G42897 [Lactuca serriola]